MKLSLIVPVFNERRTLGAILALISRALPGVEKEIIVIDDGSRDGAREWLRAMVPETGLCGAAFLLDSSGALLPDPAATADRATTDPTTTDPTTTDPTTIGATTTGATTTGATTTGATTTIIPLYHDRNRGKGAAIRTGLARFTGDVVVIQDADLEYDPADLGAMLDLIAQRGVADVVYGSRFHGKPHRSLYFHHYLANRTISLLFNMLYNQTLTDIECCYKMMSAPVARALYLTAEDFGIEIEISAAIARRRKLRIYELGISYFGRSYDEGKKIGWRDGFKALWYLLQFRFRPLQRS